ncbi:MAG TPA: hypothetical protein VHX20_16900 [Terracidiphilus sp.]|nr:hypothetical protein [Terracidiphilus sp.]
MEVREQEVPVELDWVTERSKCEVKAAFESLQEGLAHDVEQYKVQPNFGGEISHAYEPNWMIRVSKRKYTHKAVVFKVKGDHIEMQHEGIEDSEAAKVFPILTENGCCKFRIIRGEAEETLLPWQLRRRALEPVLFGHETP